MGFSHDVYIYNINMLYAGRSEIELQISDSPLYNIFRQKFAAAVTINAARLLYGYTHRGIYSFIHKYIYMSMYIECVHIYICVYLCLRDGSFFNTPSSFILYIREERRTRSRVYKSHVIRPIKTGFACTRTYIIHTRFLYAII